jgi:hypothetical protein
MCTRPELDVVLLTKIPPLANQNQAAPLLMSKLLCRDCDWMCPKHAACSNKLSQYFHPRLHGVTTRRPQSKHWPPWKPENLHDLSAVLDCHFSNCRTDTPRGISAFKAVHKSLFSTFLLKIVICDSNKLVPTTDIKEVISLHLYYKSIKM